MCEWGVRGVLAFGYEEGEGREGSGDKHALQPKSSAGICIDWGGASVLVGVPGLLFKVAQRQLELV